MCRVATVISVEFFTLDFAYIFLFVYLFVFTCSSHRLTVGIFHTLTINGHDCMYGVVVILAANS